MYTLVAERENEAFETSFHVRQEALDCAVSVFGISRGDEQRLKYGGTIRVTAKGGEYTLTLTRASTRGDRA